MGTDWEEAFLGDISDVFDSLHQTPAYEVYGIPMVRVTDIQRGYLSLDGTIKVAETTFLKYTAKTKPQKHDIVFSRVGSYGNSSLVASDESFCLGQNTALIRAYREPRFLYFVLQSSYIKQQIENAVVGSTQKTISLKSIKALRIPNPPAPYQQAIAHILGTLDDKIELLRSMNETLEAMARAHFKSWFIDFDPVRKKAEGQPTGLPPEIDALFPDSFEDSELGEIPKGWEVKEFGNFIERISVGKRFEQKTVFDKGKVPVLDQGKSGIIGYHDESPGVIASLESPVVVFANHTCYMRLIHFPFSTIQNVLPFKGKGADTIWAYYATSKRITFSEYKGHWPDFSIQKAILPSEQLTVAFRKIAENLVYQIEKNEVESVLLTKTRDSLLPRLISGEIELSDKDITKIMESAK